MLRVFDFEVNTALKDRPVIFQFITLALLCVSITIILLSSFVHFSNKDKGDKLFPRNNGNSYANMPPAQPAQLLQMKK